jgi:hypothetical protein
MSPQRWLLRRIRLPQHREIDSAKTKTREENIDAIPHMLIVQRRNCLSQCFRAVGVSPAVVQFGMCFFDRHFQWSVRHCENSQLHKARRRMRELLADARAATSLAVETVHSRSGAVIFTHICDNSRREQPANDHRLPMQAFGYD